jgi:DNA polymerase
VGLKSEELKKIYTDYCNKYKSEIIVLGEGNYNGDLLLIGEAPGKDEVTLGRPFVGKAGQNLSEFLEYINLNREDIYISNAIKYRLYKKSLKTGKIINRPATRKDILINRRYLLEEINVIKPKIISTLGNVPLRAILDDYKISIGEYHGKAYDIFIKGERYILFPLYHPASIIYNVKLKSIYLDDLMKLKECISAC